MTLVQLQLTYGQLLVLINLEMFKNTNYTIQPWHCRVLGRTGTSDGHLFLFALVLQRKIVHVCGTYRRKQLLKTSLFTLTFISKNRSDLLVVCCICNIFFCFLKNGKSVTYYARLNMLVKIIEKKKPGSRCGVTKITHTASNESNLLE